MTQPIKISMRVPGTSPMPEILDMIRRIEAAGFDGAGILDSQMICRDTFVTLGLAAGATSRLQLFPAVTNPFGRIPSVMAGAAQTVAELAPGRTRVIVGTGYTSASTIGRRPATLRQMRRCITEVKALLAGESVDYGVMSNRLDFTDGPRVPVLMAASGPRSLELAGEVADGVLALVGYTPGIVEKALGHVETGAKRSGRSLDDLDIMFAVRTCVADSDEEARRLARPVSVHWGLMWGGPNWLPSSGFEIPSYEIPQAVYDVYPDLGHAPNWEEAIELTRFVSDDVNGQLCDAMGLIGTPEHCTERIREMAQLGVNQLYLMPCLTFAPPEAEVAAFGNHILPALAAG
ncbi:MAG: LLM class flavin-dependent oxidoreductase [Chloroflexota bacterium]|nr:LLM class flavin-dependent oxidoreductase [Chloroflexota bacterium]